MAILSGGCRPAPVGDGLQTVPQARENAYRSNNLGVALLEQFKYPEAAEAFRQAIALDPSLGMAHLNLSLALLYSQDTAAAAREATEAARLMPSAPQPPYVVGLIARADNRNEEALRSFERVRQIDPRDVGTSVNLAQIYLQERQYDKAIDVLRPAAVDEPFNVTAVYDLGLALTRAGQSDEGTRMMERSQALRATGYGVTFGTTYLEQGRYAEAVASTGAETDLIDRTVSPARFTPAMLPGGPGAAGAVDPPPFGRRFSTADLNADGVRRLAASLGGGITLIDFDRDGDLDLFVADSNGQRLLRNDGPGTWTDVTVSSGLASVPANSVAIGCVAGDVDNDGAPDLFVLRYGVSSLYHNAGGGRFTDVSTAARLPAYPYLPGAAALVDVDHDGDLDIVIAGLADVAGTKPAGGPSTLRAGMAVFPRDFAPAPIELLRNNGNGTFTDVTKDAKLQARGHVIGVLPSDFDNRRDVDLLIVNADGPPLLFKNLRDGTFRDVASEVGLAAVAGAGDLVGGAATGDVNKDDFPDFFFARQGGGVFAVSDGRGRFTLRPAPEGAQAATASQFVDYDNDGLLDLVAWSPVGPRVLRNLGAQWPDVTASAVAPSPVTSAPLFAWGFATGDVDGDGRTDLVALSRGSIAVWHNSGDAARKSQRVQLKGLVSNRSGVGSKVQVRAGSLSARVETSAATPAAAPADVVFGLGTRAGADVVRVLWPSGILQAEVANAAPGVSPGQPAVLRTPLTIEELNRKPSSCPFLFTWDGERFQFVTDFMGGGEMGAWAGPGLVNHPDPLEYVRIRGDQLKARSGRYEIRITTELEETAYFDRLALMTVDHPADVDIYPNEGLSDPPKPFRLYAVRDARVPARVVDETGRDVTDAVAKIDRRYPDGFAVGPLRGYAAPHELTIDLGPAKAGHHDSQDPSAGRHQDSRGVRLPLDSARGRQADQPVLLLTAWTDYAFSSDNLAAHQAGLTLAPPSLEIRDAAGRWRTAVADLGLPVGRPQTIVADLSKWLRPGEHEVRIKTNMRIHWDQILVARDAAEQRETVGEGLKTLPYKQTTMEAGVARLHARGFSAEVRPDGKEPARYDYGRVTVRSPWKSMPGRYTREGDVRPLLATADDMFVIAGAGDEIALEFDASRAAPLPAGWTRTFLLVADGFSKEMDINSASPDTVAPLPFHRMTRYPYAAPEHYPDDPAHRRYQDTYNTRVVSRTIPLLN